MTLPQHFTEFISAFLLWVFVLWRFAATIRNGSMARNHSARRQALFMWGVYFCIALAATLLLISKLTQSPIWIVVSERSIVAIAGYLLTAAVCYELAPELRAYRKILILAGALASVVITLTLAADESLHTGVIGLAIFEYYIFLVVARVVIPAFAKSFEQEIHPPMRLRLLTMILTHVAVVLWMLNSITDHLLHLIGINYDESLLYTIALVTAVPTFISAYLLPAAYFVGVVRLWEYFCNLMAFWHIRSLEKTICRLLEKPSMTLPLIGVLRFPQEAVYMSLIAIFDLRKRIALCPDPLAQAISRRLEDIASPDLSYEYQVRSLATIARDITWLRPTPTPATTPLTLENE